MSRSNIAQMISTSWKRFPWRAVVLALSAFYFVYVSLALQRLLPLPYFLITPIGLIPYYVMAIALGVIVATWYLRKLKRQFPEELSTLSVLDLFLWVTFGGIFLGRVLHVLEFSAFYFQNLGQIINLGIGGISILGSMLGGLVGVYLYTKRAKLKFPLVLSHLLLIWPVVFAIGRSGNFFSRQLYGLPTELPWSMYIEPQFRYTGYETVPNYHPLFLYEQLLNLFLWLILLRRYRGGAKASDLFKIYVVGYSIGRFMLDFLRIEPRFMWGLTFSQVAILGLFLASILAGWLWQLRWKHKYGEWWQSKS